MACRACQQQRKNAFNAFKSGNFRQAAVETAKGAGMMTGILPKGASPDSKSRR
jgi:hypothetical protein